MKGNRHRRVAIVLALVLAVLVVWVVAAEPPDPTQSWGAGLELLDNGDFEGPDTEAIPAGWFKAMLPDITIDLHAGVEEISGRGKVAFIEQAGVKTSLCNNWAQRLRTIPVGAKVRLAAEVKTENMPADTGFVMVQFWSRSRRLIGGASAQKLNPLGGTEDWKQLSLEFTVPESTHVIIVRCGLTESGKIWFDNVSMTVVSPAQAWHDEGTFRGDGFEVTDRSLRQLGRVRDLADDVVAYARQELGAEGNIREELFAQEGGRYQIVLHLDLSASR